MAPNAAVAPPRQHGIKGVYHGGKWLDLEDCDGKFTNIEDLCSGCRGVPDKDQACPRSRSRNLIYTDYYDVTIIGAGCVGAAIARELSKYQLNVLWLEAADDVSQGATKGNSGIVHAGYDDKPGTNRAKYCWPGNQMFPKLDKELNFGYQTNGSLVIATKPEERPILEDLLQRGKTNGVKNLRIIEKKELFELEPHVNPDAIAALYSPDAGNVIPYEFTIALAENAVDNGVELRIRRKVVSIDKSKEGFLSLSVDYWEPKSYLRAKERPTPTQIGVVVGMLSLAGVAAWSAIHQPPEEFRKVAAACLAVLTALFRVAAKSKNEVPKDTPLEKLVANAGKVEGTGGSRVSVEDMKEGGSGSLQVVKGQTVRTELVRTKYVINCAGSASDQIAKMIGDETFKIKPRLGDYILLNRNQGHLAHRTLFPCPHPVLGKGVLVQTTLWGNLILGPTARDMHKKEVADMSSAQIQHYILSKCRELVPSFDPKETIHAFCGARAKSDRGDWIIETSVQDGRVIHVAGIDSPGLAGSPAIAVEVTKMLQEAGCKLEKDPKVNPRRAPIITPKDGLRGLKVGPIGKNDSDGRNEEQMAKNVICKCEKVTELEVVRALRRSLPIDSTQGIRKRTRAGMGHCQGDPENYNCEARVKAIISRETGFPIGEIGGRPWPATSTLTQRWPDDDEKKELEERMKA